MTEPSWTVDLAQVGDDSVPAEVRIAAARRLGDSGDESVLAALAELATRSDLSEELSTEVGASVARVVLRLRRLDEVPLYDFAGPAYIGYDTTVAASMRE